MDEIAMHANVYSLPTFQVYKRGKCLDSITSSNFEKIETLIKKYQ